MYGKTDEYILTHWALETLIRKVRNAVKLTLQLNGLYESETEPETVDKKTETDLISLYT